MNTNLKTTTNKLVLDFHQRNCQTVLAKEYDKGSRFIPIQCMEYGEPFTLDSSIEIQVKVLTPDNRALLEHSATIQDDGSILLELTENMLYYPGKATVELIFYDFEHKKRLSPMKFDLLIDSSAYPDDRVISSDEFNALTDLLEKANADYTYVITAARESADAAKTSEDNAASSANVASTKANEANLSALNAQESADSAAYSASCAYHSETVSEASAASALNSAKEAESWAHGNTGIREGENTNNSKYWSEQSKEYSNSWKGSLLPQGTIAFSQIPTNGNIAGHMYNINEAFVTDSRFKDGADYSYPAGTNIYWTQDGKWDCLSGTLTMTLTQAEYDNLSNAEKMNGTIYYISDADNSIGNANGNFAGLMSPEDKEKLDGIENNAEANVQSDWNVTDSNSDAYIKNKPQAMKNPTSLNISLNGVAQGAYDGSSQKNINITAENVGADSSGTAETKVSEHNASEAAHVDIRNLITTLATRLNTLADSDDTTLDQLSEIVAYIKNNKSLINGITTSKVNVSDIIDNLTSSVTNKPLSAKQGKILKDLMTTLTSTVDGKVNKAGDTMTGTLYTKNTLVSSSAAGGGTEGYINFARIKITGQYADRVILFKIGGRQRRVTNVFVKFAGDNSNPALHNCWINGDCTYGIYIVKSNESTPTWDLYAQKFMAWGEVSVLSSHYTGSVEVTYPGAFTAEKENDWIEATIETIGNAFDSDTIDGKHASDFVSKSGDTMTGDLIVPVNRANANMSVPCAGRIDSTTLIPQGLSECKTFLGSIVDENSTFWNIISTRHGNGYNDGRYFGMYIRSLLLGEGSHGGSLLWNKQMGSNKGWLGERVLLDSQNYKDFCLPLSGGDMNENAWINLDSGSGFNGGIRIEGDDYSSEYTAARLNFHYEAPIGPDNDNGMSYHIFDCNLSGNEGLVFYGSGEMVNKKISIFKDGMQFDDVSGAVTNYDSRAIIFRSYFNIQNNQRQGIIVEDNKLTPSLYGSVPHMDLGANQGNMKWKNIYAQNGTIQTSDKTKKKNINNLDIQKMKLFVNGLIPCSYEMLDGTSGRTHYGFIAQDIEELMNTLNMNSSDFAGFIKSPKKIIKYEDENGKKLENPIEEVIKGEYDYALRYDEFIAPLIKVVQEQQKTIEQQQRIIEQQQIAIENQQKEIEQIKKDILRNYNKI